MSAGKRSTAAAALALGLALGLPAVQAAGALPPPPCPGAGGALGMGFAMLLVTTVMHSIATVLQAELDARRSLRDWCAPRSHRRLLLILVTVLVTAAALLLDILLWALLYRRLGMFGELETSLYFSGVTFTTLGYGDLTLPACWRLLGVIQALNGVLMVGWSTAQLVYGVQRTMELRLASEGRRGDAGSQRPPDRG
ncbi:MAG: potassium channel family protein [Synechococcus sp.]